MGLVVDRTQNIIRNVSSDRVLVLSPKEGADPLNTLGLVDKRLFSGKNNLHCIMDKQTSLWYFNYDSGLIPQPLQQRFTSFTKAYNFAEQYFNKRNVEIKEVLDA